MTPAYSLADAHAPAFPGDYQILRNAVLNRTSLEANNNKFYVLEVHGAQGQFRLFTSYGRVGARGIQEARYTDCAEEAQAEFDRVLREKTSPRKGYVPVEVERPTVGSFAAQKTKTGADGQEQAAPTSTLHPDIARFVEHIYQESKTELARRIETPLGSLSRRQIDKGTEALAAIRFAIARGHQDLIVPLTSQYYTLIPHKLGRWTDINEVAIGTVQKADEEEELLQLMRDVFGVQDNLEADIDRKYRALGAHLDMVEPGSREYRQAEKHIRRTQSHRHPFQIKVQRIMKVCLPRERERFEQTGHPIGNVHRLFHGTRTSNMVGILSRGLLIAPKSAPVSGYMFGKGIYFADQSTKSAQYSLRSVGGRPGRSYLFLADVALGRVHKEHAPQYREDAPDGCDSVQGCKGTMLVHNEFIIYRTPQCTLRYIAEIEQA